jgi:hypothetical protein
MARHAVSDLRWPEISCVCGWATRLEDPSAWGVWAARDELLDRYLEHRDVVGARWPRGESGGK